jgi:hypothetical protein
MLLKGDLKRAADSLVPLNWQFEGQPSTLLQQETVLWTSIYAGSRQAALLDRNVARAWKKGGTGARPDAPLECLSAAAAATPPQLQPELAVSPAASPPAPAGSYEPYVVENWSYLPSRIGARETCVVDSFNAAAGGPVALSAGGQPCLLVKADLRAAAVGVHPDRKHCQGTLHQQGSKNAHQSAGMINVHFAKHAGAMFVLRRAGISTIQGVLSQPAGIYLCAITFVTDAGAPVNHMIMVNCTAGSHFIYDNALGSNTKQWTPADATSTAAVDRFFLSQLGIRGPCLLKKGCHRLWVKGSCASQTNHNKH